MRTVRRFACLVLVLLATAPRGAFAAEAHAACTGFVTVLPATISAPGTYCLSGNLATIQATGAALTLDADDITLDCNGFKLDNQAAGTGTQTTGIQAINRHGLTVRRCHVRAFLVGVDFHESGGGTTTRHLVEDNRLDAQRMTGILVHAPGSIVRRNHVTNTIAPDQGKPAYGMHLEGTLDVLDNVVAVVQASNQEVVGIYTRANHGGSVRGNRVRDVRRNGGAGNISGILNVLASSRMIVRGNVVIGEGQAGSSGIVCDSTTDRARDNSISGFATGILGCSDDGNLVKP